MSRQGRFGFRSEHMIFDVFYDERLIKQEVEIDEIPGFAICDGDVFGIR